MFSPSHQTHLAGFHLALQCQGQGSWPTYNAAQFEKLFPFGAAAQNDGLSKHSCRSRLWLPGREEGANGVGCQLGQIVRFLLPQAQLSTAPCVPFIIKV